MRSSQKPTTRALVRSSRLPLVVSTLSIAGILAYSLAQAIDEIELQIESVEGSGWRAQDVDATLELSAREPSARVRVGSFELPQFPQPLRDVSIVCAALDLSDTEIVCRDARVDANVPTLGRQTLLGSLRYERASGALDLNLEGLKAIAKNVEVTARLRDERWQVAGTLSHASLETLMKLAQQVNVPLPLELVSASGSTSVRIEATGVGADVSRLRAKGAIDALTANNESGSLASEALGASFEVVLSRAADAWSYEASFQSDRGQAYAEPIFLDFGVHPFDATARGQLTDAGQLIVDAFRVKHAGVMNAEGHAALHLGETIELTDANLTVHEVEFPGAYDSYVQPLLLETSVRSLQTSGRISGAIAIEAGEPRTIDLTFHELDVEGQQPAIAMRGLKGEWHWDADDAALESRAIQPSELTWSSGAVYGLDLGASQLRFLSAGRSFQLLAPTRIPLFDGALQIDALSVQRAGSENVGFSVDATIHPISVSRLCRAFGWPEFGGQLSGSLSNLQFDEGILRLGTTLEAHVFDGLVTVSDLRLDDPFGKWPRLHANIDLDRLDLELLTSAFSFGRITGRLSGGIHGLELFNWTPIAFDARLYTPPGDRSRRRISQRAVENIGSIGGGGAGVTAALSNGFLRFFEDFNYARLGISCKLENEVCEMNGVGPAPKGGYYLVQGRGLPRIDVIGNSARVDWPRLVQQLIAVTESSGPVVN